MPRGAPRRSLCSFQSASMSNSRMLKFTALPDSDCSVLPLLSFPAFRLRLATERRSVSQVYSDPRRTLDRNSFPGCLRSTSIPMWCPKTITSQPPAPCTSTTTCFYIRRRLRKRTIRTASSVAYAPKCFGPRSFSTSILITATCMRFPRYTPPPSAGFDR